LCNFLFFCAAVIIFRSVQSRTKLFQILFLVLTFVFLTVWSWRKGADILVDFGLQLYLPWQIASGKLLYRDVAYLPGGPFSQYFNATLFKFFGASLTIFSRSSIFVLSAISIR
jgi:hypothetical protein